MNKPLEMLKSFITLLRQYSFAHYVLCAVVIATAASLWFSWSSPLTRALRDGRRVNGIIMGTDWVDNARHSDTLIVLSYSSPSRFLDAISIPRDTLCKVPGYNFKRVNEVYAYHYRKTKDPHLAAREVCAAAALLLQSRMEIPWYVQIDYSTFKKLVDLIGGLTVEIEEPMNYDDKAGDLHIHFDPGVYHLDGKRALEYVRYRGRAGDIGRVFRQQRFVRSVLGQWKNSRFLMNLPVIVRILSTEVKTNLSAWDIISVIAEAKDLNVKNLRLSQLPGAVKGNYWEPDADNGRGLLDAILTPPSPSKALPQPQSELPQQQPAAAETTVISSATAVPGQQSTAPRPGVRVEVWNAASVPKVAEKVTWILRKHGYDVIDWGNSPARQKKTVIKDMAGDQPSAQGIVDILGFGEVVTHYSAHRFIDISVVIGQDYADAHNTKLSSLDDK